MFLFVFAAHFERSVPSPAPAAATLSVVSYTGMTTDWIVYNTKSTSESHSKGILYD